MSYKSCLACGEDFWVYPCELTTKKFCSRACYSAVGKKNITCNECGKELFINRCDTRKFCSKKCYVLSQKKQWYVERECVICKKHYYPTSPKDVRVACSKKCSGVLNGSKRKGITWDMSQSGREKISEGRKKYLSIPKNLNAHALNTKNSWKDKTIRNSRLTEERNQKISNTQIKQYASGERSTTPIYKKEHIYKSIQFRSSWEVVFAKWCDKHNIKFEYESDACRVLMDNGRTYIIDFFLPNMKIFVEVKGWYDYYSVYKLNQAVLQNYNLVVVDEHNIHDIDLNRHWINISKMFSDYEYDAQFDGGVV